MPSDTLSLTVGTGLGVSVLAGIISGVCFVIGYRRIHKKRETKWHCAVCNKYFRSPEFILGEADYVICSECNRKVCKSTCSSIQSNTSWVCQTCTETTSNWIYGAFKAVEPITKVFCATMGLGQELPDKLEEDLKIEKENKKEQVRTFIERLVNNLLGDNIDDANINEIYGDKKYLPVVGESPCSAHSALKRIIQKIIREANDLPKLKNIDHNNSSNQENRTYEDLLSTAILNKIISSSQNNISLNSSRTNSVCSHRSSSSRRRKLQKEYFFGEGTLHNKKKWRNDTDTASISSLEEWVQSDSSRGSTKYVDRVSFTIKQRIQEVSSSESDAEIEYKENDDAEYLNFKSPFANGEPNWFLQKRQVRGVSRSPIPVSMLVPDPTREAKVLIGDKEIDETSDLSDVPSDFAEQSETLLSSDVRNHLIDSKKLIGGKNSLENCYGSNFSDDDVSADSGVKECKYMDEVDSELLSASSKVEIVADASISSDGSNTEKDTEYTEKFGTLPRKISVSPNNGELSEKPISNKIKQYEDTNEIKNKNVETEDENTPKYTGIYSRREKEKWLHAVELENNPYSKENIEKRMKCRNFVNSPFGSDYYIRQAALPSGTKKNEEITPFFHEEADTSQSKECQEKGITLNRVQPNASGRFQKDKLLLMARPFYTSESPTNYYDLGMHFASEMSSDSEVSLVNCYDVKESVIYKKLTAENNEEIQTAEKYFDFESLETSLNPMDEKEEHNEQLVAEPIKQDNSKEAVQTSEIINNLDIVNIDIKHESEEYPNTTPYIITKRSDNTLIRKIYADPSVRSFALSRRKKLPSTLEVIDFANKPDLKYQKSSEQARPLMSKQYSWDNKQPTEKRQNETKFVQSIQEHNSKHKTHHEKEPSSKHKRSPELGKSSTNIQDLSNNSESGQSIETETKPDAMFPIPVEENISKQNHQIEREVQFENHKGNISPNSSRSNSDTEAFEEIDKLKKQKLVANRLKEFSKSTLDLSSTDKEVNKMITFTKIEENFSELQSRGRSSSVRDLRKKFEQFDADARVEHPILHSLTGRSLSKQFKEKLRDVDGDIPSLSQIHSLSLTNLEVEENTR